jgi:hypothetical protein
MAIAFCPAGKRAVGGGHYEEGDLEIIHSAPLMLGVNVDAVSMPEGTQTGGGWVVLGYNHSDVSTGTLVAFAACVDAP